VCGDIFIIKNMIRLKNIMSKFVNEQILNDISYGYHVTSKDNYDKHIRQHGLRINSRNSRFTIGDNLWIRRAYNMIPIFLTTELQSQYSKREDGDGGNDVLLGVDVRGLDIGADLGSLIDLGAYVGEDGFWFERMPDWVVGDGEYSYDELVNDEFGDFSIRDAIKATRTFVVCEDIESKRISYIKKI